MSSNPLNPTLSISASSDNVNEDEELEPTTSPQQHQLGPPSLRPFIFNLEPLPMVEYYHQAQPQEPPVSDAQLSIKPCRQETRAPKARSSGGGKGSGSSSCPPEKNNKSENIEPPYPWSTNKRCRLYSSHTLRALGLVSIAGRVKCRRCEQSYEMSFDLNEKFMEVGQYILSKRDEFCHRAPIKWSNPVLPRCRCCGQENSVRPEMEGKKKNINWLFLFLGELIGCCTGEQLKYFCKHNGQHRTAAKDRLLYLVYLIICMQLDPQGPFKL